MFIDPYFLANQACLLTKIHLSASLVELVPKAELSKIMQAKARVSNLAEVKARSIMVVVRLASALARC